MTGAYPENTGMASSQRALSGVASYNPDLSFCELKKAKKNKFMYFELF